MIPLHDDVRTSRRPVVNWVLIGLCALVWLLQLQQGDGPPEQDLIFRYGMIPARVTEPEAPLRVLVGFEQRPFRGEPVAVYAEAPPAPVPEWLTLLTCIFLHGGWAHFLGNMWFLVIFGDNVEDRLGRLGYLLFYLLAGFAASLAHLLSEPGSTAPTVGASGAIAGVMGAYLVLYPRARVLTLVPLGFILELLVLPAKVFLGIWFVMQVVLGSLSLGMQRGGGVAFWAHAGGFVAGLGGIFLCRALGLLRPPPEVFELQRRRLGRR